MSEERIVRASLGRIADIGDLYNARSDNFCGYSVLKRSAPSGAVKVVDNPFTDTQFIYTDSYSDKFDKLNIRAELKVSVLAGLFSLEGHGHYLRDEKKSARAVRSSLLYNIHTKVEKLNLFNEDLRDCFSMDALDIREATHVVVEVLWGAKSMVTMEYANTENRDVTEIGGQLKAELEKIAFSVSGKAGVDYVKSEEYKEKSFSLKIFADLLPNNEIIPQTYAEALELMKKMPTLIQTANQGKGKPIQYTLVSISVLRKYLREDKVPNLHIKELDEQSIIRLVRIFDDICAVKQELYDIYSDMNGHRYCVPKEMIAKIEEIKTEMEASEAIFRANLAKTLVDVRSGNANVSALEDVRSEFLNGEHSVVRVRDILNGFNNVLEKIKFADILAKEGVTYIGFGASIETEQMKHSSKDIYVLYFGDKFREDNQQLWSSNRHHFLSLMRETKKAESMGSTNTTFMAVDCDIRPEVAVSEGVKNGISICHYRNGKYISFDVLQQIIALKSQCLARSKEVNPFAVKPNRRIDLSLRCPASITGECEIRDHDWICAKCGETLEYDLSINFYCTCGSAAANSYEFKCNSGGHGLDYVKYDESTLTALLKNINPLRKLNILLLGETGAGKSTYINAIANYMSYPSLEVAQQSDPISLIAASFTMTDDNGEQRVITTGSDGNEVRTTGRSTTQSPKSYLFRWADSLVRLIDTPGFGDTRGVEQDSKSLDSILGYLKHFRELHGICICLKTNQSESLTDLFQFYVKELFTRLHRSAVDNIVFCFTNARITSYRPEEDLLSSLKKLLVDNKVDITLDKNAIYCVDNESFRFVCAAQHGMRFDDTDRQNHSSSWNRSAADTHRMFQRIASLRPHTIGHTILLNTTRKVIASLCKPLTDAYQSIEHNIDDIDSDTTSELIRTRRELDGELNVIIDVSGVLDCFLKRNAITAGEQVMREYLDVIIEDEERRVAIGADSWPLDCLKRMRNSYSQKMVGMDSDDSVDRLGAEHISKLVVKLHALPRNGPNIKVNTPELMSARIGLLRDVHYKPKISGITQMQTSKTLLNPLYLSRTK